MYVDRLQARARPADALWFGVGVHEALAEWYQPGFERGMIPSAYWRNWVGKEIRFIKANYEDHDREWFEEPVYIEAGELGVAMLDNYLNTYDDDPDLEIIAIEQPFELELVRDGKVIAIFIGVFDGVAFDHELEMLVLLEHKTAGAIKTAHLPLDNQAGSYFAAASIVLRHQGILGKKEVIEGIKYNFLRKAKSDNRKRDAQGRCLNKDGKVSKVQPARPFVREFVDRSPREVNSQLRQISDEIFIMNKVRSGELPITKVKTDMCPYCPFFQMCVMHERGGRAWMEFRDAQYRVGEVSPLRKSAAE
jgi:hypothetical protein